MAGNGVRLRTKREGAMLRFILTRMSLVVPTFIGITLLVFVLIRLIPGDPIETMAGERGIDPCLLYTSDAADE